jgi:hypothetical protein
MSPFRDEGNALLPAHIGAVENARPAVFDRRYNAILSHLHSVAAFAPVQELKLKTDD